MKLSTVAIAAIVVAVAAGAAYLGGVKHGQAVEQRKAYELERRARIDSIRVAELVKDSTARELREATRLRDSAAAAQRVKRSAFTIVNDTTVLVVGDSTPIVIPPRLAPMITYVRGEDAKVAVDSAWMAKIAADTMAIANQRDLWKRRALAAEKQLEKERHRFGLKTGIAIGATSTLLVIRALAEIVR